VELVTFRCDAHSTSDDPTQYRAADEADHWPGGDPIERLKRHLISTGEWSEESHRNLSEALEQEMAETFRQAESFGSLAAGLGHVPDTIFDDVYASLPPHLQAQLTELKAENRQKDQDEHSVLSFAHAEKRFAG